MCFHEAQKMALVLLFFKNSNYNLICRPAITDKLQKYTLNIVYYVKS